MSAPMLALRPYQERTLAELWRWFEQYGDGDPIVEACVGAGKSVLIAELCRRAIAQVGGTRILMLVHSKELIEQNLAKLLQVWPQAPVGVYSASVGARQLGRAITYATVASVAKRVHQLGHVDLLLIDECHLVGPGEATMYRRLIDELRRYCPALRVIGWTGTAFRGDGVWLTQQGLFSHVAARVTMGELLGAGYLAPLVIAPTEAQIDTSGVKLVAGEYNLGQLARASDKAELVRAACAELVRLAAGRRRWLVFAVTVAHAEHIAAELQTAHGIACAVVSADTPKAERAQRIGDFRAGKLRALVNVAVLTTGFDVPELDCIALLRATKSPVLYVQIAGRGMRTAPGKADCLWLDFTDTTATLGPVDAIKGRNKPPLRDAGVAQPAAPAKHCEHCGNPNPAAALACVHCGHDFPPPERVRHDVRADAFAAVLSTAPVWHSITRVQYRRHPGRDGKRDTLRVDYFSGLRQVASEWVCLEHPGGSYARTKADAWWTERASPPAKYPPPGWLAADLAAPKTIDKALQIADAGALREPGRIAVRVAGKYPEIVDKRFAPQQHPMETV